MSWLSKAADTVTGGFNAGTDFFQNLLGFNVGSKPGVQNPFAPPDLSFLSNNVDLTKDFKSIGTGRTGQLFQDLLGSIGTANVTSDKQLQEILKKADINTNQAAGSLKSDFLDRGLGAPGVISEMEATGLGQVYGQGAQIKTDAELALEQSKEAALSSAYGGRYAAGLDTAKSNASMYNNLLATGAGITADKNIALAKQLSDLYSGGAQRQVDTMQPGYLDSILRNIRLNVSPSMMA